jgi:hypothetical protein
MATVIVGARGRERAIDARKRDPAGVVVEIRRGSGTARRGGPAPCASVEIAVRDRGLGRELEREITSAVRAAIAAHPPFPCPSLCVRSKGELTRARGEVAGAIVVVPVDPGRVRALPSLLDAAETLGAAGIQLVVAARGKLPDTLVRALFPLLESRRGSAGRCPILLTRTDALAEIWYFVALAGARTTARGAAPAPDAGHARRTSQADRYGRMP